MKYFYKISLIILCITSLSATSKEINNVLPAGIIQDSIVKVNSGAQKFAIVPGEILVRFKDELSIKTQTRSGIAQTGLSSVDEIFRTYRVAENLKLFPHEKMERSKTILRGYNGVEVEKPNLHNIYKIKIENAHQLYTVIELLSNDPNVLYAEPNYVFSLTDHYQTEPLEPSKYLSGSLSGENYTREINTPNDPLYSQQTYIPAVHANEVWDSITTDSLQIIAILDTGVDWMHPDLQNKIWTNPGEIPGNGNDDDNNGKIDDVRGWDWINNDQNPMDDNNHGTHVAGIAAAERNNGLGISGISQAKIMPLKAFTSAGYGNTADITQAINYAAANGATIINMSFGTYARSFVMENALINAYATCELVASAGNDRESIYMSNASDDKASAYPAALPYVLGVEAESGFSNYDPDGPVFSLIEEGFNYELRAPGSGLLSTARNGTYVNMTGTSMAAPVVSGSIALYKAFHPNRTREEMWADLIYNSSYYIDIKESCVNDVKHPVLNLVEYHVVDTIAGGDGDGQADAGEQIQLWIQIKNTFGYADSAYALIRQTNTGDTTDVTIVSDSSYFGSISTFGSLTNEFMPFIIQINESAGNNRNIELEVVMANHGDTVNFTSTVTFRIYNGEELSGLLTQDKVLTPDKFWLINNSLRIGTGVTLTIMPGTSIEINAGVDNRGYVHAVGTQDSLINMFGIINGNTRLEYVNADLRGSSLSTSNIILNCEIYNVENIYTPKVIHSYIHDVNGSPAISADSIISSVIEDVFEFYGGGTTKAMYSQFKNVNLSSEGGFFSAHHCIFDDFMNIYAFIYPSWPSMWTNSYLFKVSNESANRYYKNTFFKNLQNAWFVYAEGGSDFINFPGQYWGTTDSIKIKDKYFDFWNSAGLPFLITDPILNPPSDSCPGHVWKILVNNFDAQDDVKEPLGVGVHKFEVYFNRAMDINYTPMLSFGLNFPYLQHTIADSASWSADHKIWTAYKKVELFSGDGINRLRVDNARDMNGMKIPLEDDRFEFIIQAAGSSSIDFIATPGLGKISLEWNNSGIEDLLGFNMYRFQHITDTTFTNPTLINSTLITDTAYVDFDILPNVRYYYYYKILNTDFAESDSSKVITAIPLTAQIGDANGDLSVNVLDITTMVSYLLYNNPQPFIFEAADVNADLSINVLDIVGLVNIVMGNSRSVNFSSNELAYLYIENDTLFADIPVAIGGIQFELGGIGIEDIAILKSLTGFESGHCMIDNKLRLLIYSMSGKSLAVGKRIPLIKISIPAWIENPILADTRGGAVNLGQNKVNTNISGDIAKLGQNYPNPFTGETVIPVTIYHQADQAVLRIVNMYGQHVGRKEISSSVLGEHLIRLAAPGKGFFLYYLEFKLDNQVIRSQAKKMLIH